MYRKMTLMLALAAVCCGAVAQTSSVLASGSWWRVEVASSGIYRLTTADVPALQGASVATIGLYGSNGEVLSLDNHATPTDDLQPVAIDINDRNGNGLFDSGDELLFYGEGTGVWRWQQSDQRWEFRQHPYATTNSYYLTLSSPAPLRITVASSTGYDTTVTTHTAVTHVENDLLNLHQSGQVWLGEKFSSSQQQRSFTLTFPQSASNLRVRYALACKSSVTSSFLVRCGSTERPHYINPADPYATILETFGGSGTAFTFDLTFRPGESTATGYLDYIEINGRTTIAFGSGQTTVRNDGAIGDRVRYLAGGSGSFRVWDVTGGKAVRELAVSNRAWVDSGATAKAYALFDGNNYLTPASVTALANQDLHGMGEVDYIVVCTPTLLAQAERLAALHAILDGMNTVVVTDAQVYNEFSYGKQDPMAIRAMLRHLRTTHEQRPPRYMAILGKATYDNRHLLGDEVPTVVTYETPDSFDDIASYCSDDIMGHLDPWESGAGSGMDISIGRLPARNAAEAELMIDKIEGYVMRRDLTDPTAEGQGDWRNYVGLLADDADPSHPGDTAFAHSSEYVANLIKLRFPNINVDRFYADAYHQQSGAIGSFYPDLNNALRQRMNYGCLLLNYIGHGSERYIGTERYIEPGDISAYTNRDRLPLVVTSTCSYGRHDSPDELCGAELFMLSPYGAIGVVSASRKVSHVQRFNSDVVLFSLDTANTIGDALRLAKNRTVVPASFGLTGDPAVRLSVPKNRVVVTKINNRPVQEGVDDTATVLSMVTVSGEVQTPDGQLIADFDGTVYPIAFDREMRSHTLANDNPETEVSFVQQKSILYKGTDSVRGGRFEYSFIVPRDVAYQYDYGKLSHYARSGGEDAAGSYSRILFGGLDESAVVGDTRPVIRLFMGDTNFRDGGLTDAEPTLIALLSDSVGINAVGSGLGHDITAVLDGNPGSLIVLGDMYEPDMGDSRSGTVRYTLTGLTSGMHTLTLKAWNIWGNSSTAEISFRVASTDTLTFSTLSVYPNPAREKAVFHYETNSTESITSAVLQIYTTQGALLCSLTPTVGSGSYVVGPVVWNLAGVAPGLYLARMLVTTDDGKTHQSTAKVAVR